MIINVEYELDQWEWQGRAQSVEIVSDDFEGMSDKEIRTAIHQLVREDGEQKTHFVYPEDEIVQEIKAELAKTQEQEA